MNDIINLLDDWEILISDNMKSFEDEFCHGGRLHDVYWNFRGIKVYINVDDTLVTDSHSITKWLKWVESVKN